MIPSPNYLYPKEEWAKPEISKLSCDATGASQGLHQGPCGVSEPEELRARNQPAQFISAEGEELGSLPSWSLWPCGKRDRAQGPLINVKVQECSPHPHPEGRCKVSPAPSLSVSPVLSPPPLWSLWSDFPSLHCFHVSSTVFIPPAPPLPPSSALLSSLSISLGSTHHLLHPALISVPISFSPSFSRPIPAAYGSLCLPTASA